MELTSQLRRIEDMCAEASTDLRARALAIDTAPGDVDRHLGSTAFALNRVFCTPEQFRADGLKLPFDIGRTCLERIVSITALSRGDAAGVLACPGPALAGLVVDLLGSDEQQERFYRRISDGRTWTFFAMTEPGAGSDAANLTTRLSLGEDGDHLVLIGEKRYIGNGDRGGIGVVFARTSDSVLGIRAVVLELPSEGVTTRSMPMLGLRGADLSEMTFDQVQVCRSNMLGEHLRTPQRGLWGALRTFHQVRTQIGAMAVGTAMALHDTIMAEFPRTPALAEVGLAIEAAKWTVFDAASALDSDPLRSHVSSIAKLSGTRLVTDVAAWAVRAAGPGGWADHPLLEKWARDARGFEFMDGTANMQRLAVARGYLQETVHG
ncbi:acyl-CoA dehydrogenase [Lentzea alba]|uniref:acyl-CoA dehydrogenase family protein n=1 Tax=Lentzea alba TaxID=2714351 RepID=UPI0039BF01B8